MPQEAGTDPPCRARLSRAIFARRCGVPLPQAEVARRCGAWFSRTVVARRCGAWFFAGRGRAPLPTAAAVGFGKKGSSCPSAGAQGRRFPRRQASSVVAWGPAGSRISCPCGRKGKGRKAKRQRPQGQKATRLARRQCLQADKARKAARPGRLVCGEKTARLSGCHAGARSFRGGRGPGVSAAAPAHGSRPRADVRRGA